jgi:hypothetical protein
MSAAIAHKLIAHFGGSIPLPDAETVFRTLAAATARWRSIAASPPCPQRCALGCSAIRP